jgi:hypothetical protein
MSFPRLTWAGLLIATFGWGLLLSHPLISSHGINEVGEMRDPTRFILVFGENAVITGFALAVLGTLERAIVLLSRLAGVATNTAVSTNAARSNVRNASTHGALTPTQSLQQPQLMSHRSAHEVITRGALNGRDYVLFRDGSVLVETLLGPRRFPSIIEAQEFIGAS